MKKVLFIFFLSLIFFFSSNQAFALSSKRVIIKFKDSVSQSQKNSSLSNLSLLKKEKLLIKNAYALDVKENDFDKIFSLFKNSSLIDYVEQDYIAQKAEVPNDPYISSQWGLSVIHAFDSWNTTHGGSAVVAVVDTGIDGSHPDLSSKILKRANFTTNIDADGDGHGTHVAGIAAASTNNSIGIAGVGYDTKLFSVKSLDNNGSGYYSWVANGITWAVDNGANVINLSLGGTSSSTTLKNAIDYAWGKGLVIVAAAGNSNSSRKFYPAYYFNVVSVGATDQSDVKASFSNFGTWVTLAAPGVSIYSTYRGGYGYLSGTSMAAPLVSGLSGLLFGQHPDWSNSQVRNQIQNTSDKIAGTGKYWIYGRINSCMAVGCSLSPTPSSTPTPTPTPIQSGQTPTSTPTPISATPTPSSIPTPTPTPWWCSVFPNLCK